MQCVDGLRYIQSEKWVADSQLEPSHNQSCERSISNKKMGGKRDRIIAVPQMCKQHLWCGNIDKVVL